MRTNRLTSIIAAMKAPEFELDTNEAAILISAVDSARAAGHAFDALALCLAILDVLRRQLQQSDDGLEDVGVDDGFEDPQLNPGDLLDYYEPRKVRIA